MKKTARRALRQTTVKTPDTRPASAFDHRRFTVTELERACHTPRFARRRLERGVRACPPAGLRMNEQSSYIASSRRCPPAVFINCDDRIATATRPWFTCLVNEPGRTC